MNKPARNVGLICSGVALLVGLYLFDPSKVTFFPRCPLHELTGLYCPGCGTTRALYQLAHGHLLAAFRLNPLAVVLLPVAALAIWRRKQSIRPVWIWTLLSVVAGFGILRNVPWLTP